MAESIERPQRIHHAPAAGDVPRIWIPMVGQGDGILIRLRAKHVYELELEPDRVRDEFIDIVIDAGGGST